MVPPDPPSHSPHLCSLASVQHSHTCTLMGDSKELFALIYRLVFGEKNLLYRRSENFRVNKLLYDCVENFLYERPLTTIVCIKFREINFCSSHRLQNFNISYNEHFQVYGICIVTLVTYTWGYGRLLYKCSTTLGKEWSVKCKESMHPLT